MNDFNNSSGYWTAHHLALKGATVVMGCRTMSKCKEAAGFIQSNITAKKSGGKVVTLGMKKKISELENNCCGF